MDLHPDLAPISWLVGRWAGQGSGQYPTTADFEYREESTWTHVGKPFLAYTQATWATDDGRPLHGERGFLRVAGGALELVLAHSNGIGEVAVAELSSSPHFRSVSVNGAPSAKEVSSLERRLWLEAGVLHYELGMGAVGVTHQIHLRAALTGIPS